jgi:PadR family transcriptional regulator AphA
MSAGHVSLRHFILGLLTQEPMSGYDIKRALKGLGWLVGEPSFGSLYPALNALAKEGLVTMELEPRENRPSRKIYTIAETGRQTLQEWINRPAGSNSSMKAFVMRLILADNLSQAGMIAQLYQRRAEVAAHRAVLVENVSIADDTGGEGQLLALEYGLALASAELAWLDGTLDRLSPQLQPMEVVQGD